jgi:hypothetical protein
MSDEPQVAPTHPLTDEEKALLRRCYRISKMTDDEIVFPVSAVASGKAAWLTMLWFVCMGAFLICRWAYVSTGAPTLVWLLLGVFPTYGLIWLAAHRRSRLVLGRGTRTMIVDLGDGTWTIQLPQGVSPANWDFPTASIPGRMGTDEVERVNASEVIERYAGLSLDEPIDTTSALGLLQKCGADVVGYDADNVSIANFGSGRSGVVFIGLLALCGPLFFPIGVFVVALASGQLREPPLVFSMLVAPISMLGGLLMAWDSRASSVATFQRGERQVHLRRRGVSRLYDVHESAVSVISDGDVGELVIVPQVFSCSPTSGTANLLAGFLRRHLAPLKRRPPTTDT